MDIVAIIGFGGLLMIAVGLVGSIQSEKLNVPKLPKWARGVSLIIGIALLFLAIYIFPESPFNPNAKLQAEQTAFQATQTAFQATETAFTNLPAPTPITKLITVTQPAIIVTRVITIPHIPASTVTPNDLELLVESMNSTVYVSLSKTDLATSSSELRIINQESGPEYQHRFSFSDEEGGTGLYFFFDPDQDLSIYKSVVFTLNVDDGLTECAFRIVDIEGNNQGTPCQSPFDSSTGITVSEDGRTLTIPLQQNFPEINLKVVEWLYFWIPASDTEGKEVKYTVSGLKFIKP